MPTSKTRKPTRLAQEKAAHDATGRMLSHWQCAFAWIEAGLIAATHRWSDSTGGRLHARLVRGPRGINAFVVLTFTAGAQIPAIRVADAYAWMDEVVRDDRRDSKHRDGELAAVEKFRVALAR